MTDRDHRHWFGFLEKLAALSREYSIDDLRWLKKEAARRYPSTAPLIEACLTLAASESRSSRPISRGSEASSEKRHVDGRVSSPLSDVLHDTIRFPANSDLVMFARSALPALPRLRFDKMGRTRIVDTIMAHVQKAPAQTKRNFEASLLGGAEIQSPAEAESSFLSGWEKVIKGA